MKKLKWIGISLVGLIIVALLVVWMSINGIVRSVVESQASDSLNLQTTLGGANVSIFGQSLGLSDLQIASPQGFSAPRMFTLDGVKVGASFGHLRADPIGVDNIVIDKPKLVIEQSGGKLNFQTLMDTPSKQPQTPATGGQRQAGEPIHLVIHNLTINQATVVLRPGIPGLDKEIDISIPSVELKEIGNSDGNQDGAAIRQVVMLVITSMAQKATESDQIPPQVRQLLNLNADQVRQRVAAEVTNEQGRIAKQLDKKLPGDVGKNAGKVIEQGIGGLLNGGKQSTTKPK